MEFTYESFSERAKDSSLSKWEKIGFPDSYRRGLEESIFDDISSKTRLSDAKLILDIGCGCSDLVENFISHAVDKDQSLYLVDSPEMLNSIDGDTLNENIYRVSGRFPDSDILGKLPIGSFDVIVVYSVIQYVFINQSIYNFVHECIKLLKPGGRLLIGDIPNYQARERFLQSSEGQGFVRNENKVENTINLEHENQERLDDSTIMSLLMRFRNFNCETYLLPQAKGLPFSNRREDVLILKR